MNLQALKYVYIVENIREWIDCRCADQQNASHDKRNQIPGIVSYDYILSASI